MSWINLQREILEEFAYLSETYRCGSHVDAIVFLLERRREAVRRYRAKFTPVEQRERDRASYKRRSERPGFRERESARVAAYKEQRRMINRKRIKPTTFSVAVQPDGAAVLTIDMNLTPLEIELSPSMWAKLADTVRWFETQKLGAGK